jgi:glycosyltransferase involved in cell wall biosynthesis
MACISNGGSKRVLILDISPRGHHPFYLRTLLDSDLAQSAEILLAVPQETLAHPAIAACSDSFRGYPIELAGQAPPAGAAAVLLSSWAIGRLYRQVFCAVAASAPIDFVIVPYVDDCLLGLAAPSEAFFGTPWLAITMRTMFHYRAIGVRAPEQSFARTRRWLASRILRQHSTRAVLTIDPTLAEFAAKQRQPMFRKIRYVPDPATRHALLPSKREARRRLDIPADARVILLYGAITERKGTSLLVQAAASPECSQQIHLLIAGKYWGLDALQESDAWRGLAGEGRIHAFNGFVDEAHEQLVLAAADCMWVGYVDFYGVSSVMALAGCHAMPVLASAYGLVGYFTGKYELGTIVEPRDQASIVSALNRVVSEPEFFLRAGRNGIALYQGHSPIELQRLVTDMVGRSWAESTSSRR